MKSMIILNEYYARNSLKNTIKFIILYFVIAALCVFISVSVGRLFERRIAVVYEEKVTLAEDVVFDSPEFLKNYQETIVLPAGTKGSIGDIIQWCGDEHGSDFMSADFRLDDGSFFYVDISIHPVSNYVIIQDNPSDFVSAYYVTPVFSATKLDDYETVVNGYLQLREEYHMQVRRTRIISVVVGAASLLVISAVIFRRFIKGRKTDSEIKS